MAVNVRGHVVVREIKYNEQNSPMYQFSRYESDQLCEVSELFSSPTPAFTQVITSLGKTGERPNGKLVLGVQYGEPQRAMREEFLRNAPYVVEEAKKLYQEWLSAVSVSAEPSSRKFAPLLSRKRSSVTSIEDSDDSFSASSKKSCFDFAPENWMNDIFSIPIISEVGSSGFESADTMMSYGLYCDQGEEKYDVWDVDVTMIEN